MLKSTLLLIAICFLVSCGKNEPHSRNESLQASIDRAAVLPPKVLTPVSVKNLPKVVVEGKLEDFKLGVEREVAACKKSNQTRELKFGQRKITAKVWCVQTGEKILEIISRSENLEMFWTKASLELKWYKSSGDGEGLVKYTGYFSPLLNVSKTEAGSFLHPIYKKPSDLVRTKVKGKEVWRRKKADGTLDMYPERKEIQDGYLKNKNLEIGYAEDLFDVFILQVQGAGILQYKDTAGDIKRVTINYAAQNGREYVAIRSVMMKKGIDAKYWTIPGMRKYFAEHPEELIPMLNSNPSYVFFLETTLGPVGATSTELVSRHSIAIDPTVHPLSGFALVKTNRPVITNGEVTSWETFSTLAVSNDVGGAIKGAGRVDFYWGEDDYAEAASGYMNQPGELYFALVPEMTTVKKK